MEPQMDMQQLFAAAQQMQEQLMNAQQALADAEVTGTAGGGLVRATVNGQGELMDLSIDPAAVDPADPEETARTIADLDDEKDIGLDHIAQAIRFRAPASEALSGTAN